MLPLFSPGGDGGEGGTIAARFTFGLRLRFFRVLPVQGPDDSFGHQSPDQEAFVGGAARFAPGSGEGDGGAIAAQFTFGLRWRFFRVSPGGG